MDLLLRAPEALVKELDARVDKDRFKNRTHLVLVVLADWLVREMFPIDPYTKVPERLEEEEAYVREDRLKVRRKLLGDEWDKYKEAGGDMLDGEWETQRSFEEMEKQTAEFVKREALKAEITRDVLEKLREEIPELSNKPKRKKKTDAKKKTPSR